mmetsp:Transcript_3332/g.9999  ORF Transcript_3332/g.9999 Transcript_3332/m.9999 type:complete len:90 (-) Transcript_3332:29-298(-)
MPPVRLGCSAAMNMNMNVNMNSASAVMLARSALSPLQGQMLAGSWRRLRALRPGALPAPTPSLSKSSGGLIGSGSACRDGRARWMGLLR